MEPTLCDIDLTNEGGELGLFYKRLGEICFSSLENQQFGDSVSSVAVAPEHGIVCFSDSNGVYIASTSDLINNLQKWNTSDDEPLPPASTDICQAVLPISGAPLLSLSPDASVLAVASGATVYLYSLYDILTKGRTNPAATEELSSPVTTFHWQPSTSNNSTTRYALCTEAGTVLVGGINQTPQPLPGAPKKTVTLSWSPDGQFIALGHKDFVTICLADGGATASVHIKSQESEEADEMTLLVNSVRWVNTNNILVASRLIEGQGDGGDEQPFAPLGVVSWQGTLPDPSNAKILEFFPINTETNATASTGPWLLTTQVPQWLHATIYSHRKAMDDHIKLLAILKEQEPVAVDITEDALAIRIPNAVGDEDNFVVGLGVDFTSIDVVVQHPTDATAPDLPPQPVLIVATSDGVLRFYSFGCFATKANSDILACGEIVREAVEVPQPAVGFSLPPSSAVSAVDGVGVSGEGVDSSTDAAAGTALPDEDSDLFDDEEEDEEEQEKESVAAPSQIPKPLAPSVFGAAPPVVGASQSKLPSAPLPSTTTSGFGGFSFGGTSSSSSSATAATTTAAATVPKLTGFATTGGLNFSAFAADNTPFSTDIGTARGGGVVISGQPVRTASNDSTNNTGIDFTTSSNPQADIKKLVKGGNISSSTPPSVSQQQQQQQQDIVVETKPPPPPVPPPEPTQVPPPVAKLQTGSSEVASMESDFLNTLMATRKKEAGLFDALNTMFEEHDGPGVNKKQFAEMRDETQTLRKEAAVLSDKVNNWKGETQVMTVELKEAYRKIEAMPSFNNKNANMDDSAGATGIDNNDVASKLQRQQPIDPALESLRLRVRSQLRTLSDKTEELKDCLLALEQQQHVGVPQLSAITSQQLFSAVQAQTAVIKSQTQRIGSIAMQLDNFGLLPASRWDAVAGGSSGGGLLVVGSPTAVGEFDLGFRLNTLKASTGDIIQSTPSLDKRHSVGGSSSNGNGRLPWRLVRDSPLAAAAGTVAVASPERTRAAAVGGANTSSIKQLAGMKARILKAAAAPSGTIRVTASATTSSVSNVGSPLTGSADVGKAASLPPLPPLVLPALPRPHMPAPKPKKKTVAAVAAPPAFGITSKPSLGSLAAKPSSSSGLNFATTSTAAPRPALKPISTSSTSSSAPKLPPIPTASQMRSAANLAAQALSTPSSTAKPAAAAAAPPKPAASSSMPPIPSKTQFAAAQSLMSNVPTPSKPPPTTTTAAAIPPVASNAAAKAAQARFDSFLSTEKTTTKEESPTTDVPDVHEPKRTAAASTGFGFGNLAVSKDSETTASTTTTTPVASLFGSTTTAAAPSLFGASSSASAAASTTTTPAKPFGSALNFASVASSSPAAAAAPSAFGGSGFNTTTTSSASSSSAFGVASTGGALSSFGTTSFFGITTTTAASSASSTATTNTTNVFGGSSTFGVSTPAPPATTSSTLFGGGVSGSMTSTGSAFGTFGQSSGFGSSGFGGASPAPAAAAMPSLFGAASSAAASSSPFGTPSAFGPPPTPSALRSGSGGLGSGGFGQPAGFGSSAMVGGGGGFGQLATPGFGQPAAHVASSSPFGGGSGVAGGGNASGGGFGAFAGQAQSGSGFAAFAQQGGGGFGGFGGAANTPPKAPTSGGSMWQPRK